MDPLKRGLAAYKKIASPASKSEPTPPAPSETLPRVSRPSFPQFTMNVPVEKVSGVPPQGKKATSEAALPTQGEEPSPKKTDPKGFLKTTVKEKSLRKVAKFLILLGKEEAAKVIRHLSPEEVEDVTREIATVKFIDPSEAEKILRDFGYMAVKATEEVKGGPEMAKAILERALGREKAKGYLKRNLPEYLTKPFSFLEDLEPEVILILLKDESIPVLSIVLPHLKPQKAAAIMKVLPLEFQKGLVKRLSQLDRVSKVILENIEAKLRDKVREMGAPQETEKMDGRDQLSQILKHMGSESKYILEAVAEVDPKGAALIRDKLFGPDTLLKIRDLDLENWLRDFEDAELGAILLSLDPKTRERVSSLISGRRMILLEQEMEIMGALRKADGVKILKEFLAKMRSGLEEGALRMQEPDSGEEYV